MPRTEKYVKQTLTFKEGLLKMKAKVELKSKEEKRVGDQETHYIICEIFEED